MPWISLGVFFILFEGTNHGLVTIFTNCLRTGICVARSQIRRNAQGLKRLQSSGRQRICHASAYKPA